MRIARTESVMFSQFLSFLLSTGEGVGGVSGKVHYEHIIATKVLMPVGGRGVQESALWAHSCYKSAHACGGWVGVQESAL